MVRWGVLGAAWIADRAMLPALRVAGNARLLALASHRPAPARELASRHGIERLYPGYEELLADPEVDAVYIPLPNSLHRPWTLRALAAGKHVLCEKPLALNADEALAMAQAAQATGRLLMEALMYRFHPRMRRLAEGRTRVRFLHAAFGFPLIDPDNYRLRAELGGGALLDVGCYLVDVARWLVGSEPTRVEAVAHFDSASGVDLSCTALLGFPAGEQASLHASFESPEHQELVVVGEREVVRVKRPFTSWRDPDDPYQLMVEAFGEALLRGTPAPLPLEWSIANLRVLDRIRAAVRSAGT